MTDLTRDIPLPVKRQLRQESGFGCCLCGNPIIEYHHIQPFGRQQTHDPVHMMTLCPLHHHEATVGGLTEEEQRRSKDDPANIRHGYVEGLLRVTEPGVAVHLRIYQPTHWQGIRSGSLQRNHSRGLSRESCLAILSNPPAI